MILGQVQLHCPADCLPAGGAPYIAAGAGSVEGASPAARVRARDGAAAGGDGRRLCMPYVRNRFQVLQLLQATSSVYSLCVEP